jgi:putative redox protein
MQTDAVTFQGGLGETLSARLERPDGAPSSYALFAHCFTCGKDSSAAVRVARGLAARGIAVLRFDFTGLGASDGDFSGTDFSSNLADLSAAADFMREQFAAPALLIGHSLGGAAVLAGAHLLPEVKAVVAIAAPSDVAHVTHNFADALPEIEAKGEAKVTLGARTFVIRKSLVDDLRSQPLGARIAGLKRALLLMHAPTDTVVGVENAAANFMTARHPKSFIALPDADHFLSRPVDTTYAADMIAAWAGRFIGG